LLAVLLDRGLCEHVDQSVASIKTRWYQQQIHLKSVTLLLEETAEYWSQYTAFINVFFRWLPEAEQVLVHRVNGWQVGSS